MHAPASRTTRSLRWIAVCLVAVAAIVVWIAVPVGPGLCADEIAELAQSHPEVMGRSLPEVAVRLAGDCCDLRTRPLHRLFLWGVHHELGLGPEGTRAVLALGQGLVLLLVGAIAWRHTRRGWCALLAIGCAGLAVPAVQATADLATASEVFGLLFGLGGLALLLEERLTPARVGAATAVYLMALLEKEVHVVLLAPIGVALAIGRPRRRALLASLPFAVVTLAFFARYRSPVELAAGGATHYSAASPFANAARGLASFVSSTGALGILELAVVGGLAVWVVRTRRRTDATLVALVAASPFPYLLIAGGEWVPYYHAFSVALALAAAVALGRLAASGGRARTLAIGLGLALGAAALRQAGPPHPGGGVCAGRAAVEPLRTALAELCEGPRLARPEVLVLHAPDCDGSLPLTAAAVCGVGRPRILASCPAGDGVTVLEVDPRANVAPLPPELVDPAELAPLLTRRGAWASWIAECRERGRICTRVDPRLGVVELAAPPADGAPAG